jgi:3-dehydroquinate synthetase
MIADKKKINGDIKFTLLETIGKGIINVTVPLDLVRQAVLYFNNHNRVHAV